MARDRVTSPFRAGLRRWDRHRQIGARRPPDNTVYGVRTTDRVAFLTIDDGVTRDPGMVKALRDAKVKATFFLTAQYVRADPGFFARLARETGSVVENHTLTHPNLEGMSRDAQRHEICGASDDFAKDFGRRPTLLRPPYGARDETTADAAAECGITHIVNWGAEIAGRQDHLRRRKPAQAR